MTAGSIRARVRAEMVDEIKSVARRHLAVDGANLSLRAVARDMGMVSSALYRYFASRDELLTALIIDAYNSMGEAAEHADAGVTDRSDLVGRWLAVARALRAWALARPHEYALIYGSPVPGYAAPADTVGPVGHRRIRPFGHLPQRVVRVEDQRGEQVVAAGEVAVQGGGDHAHVPRDGTQGQVGPVGGEVPAGHGLDLVDQFRPYPGPDRSSGHAPILAHIREQCS